MVYLLRIKRLSAGLIFVVDLISVIYNATVEIAPAITVAIATTVVSFLPVFFMEHAEGKLFRPLAFTKTFALGASFLIGVIFLPTLAYIIFGVNFSKQKFSKYWNGLLVIAGIILAFVFNIFTYAYYSKQVDFQTTQIENLTKKIRNIFVRPIFFIRTWPIPGR